MYIKLLNICYNVEIGRPVFDRIELTLYHRWIPQLLHACKIQWFLYFLYFVQAAQPVPST